MLPDTPQKVLCTYGTEPRVFFSWITLLSPALFVVGPVASGNNENAASTGECSCQARLEAMRMVSLV